MKNGYAICLNEWSLDKSIKNELGLLLISDERGRVYPAGRQASSVTDALRFFLAEHKAEIKSAH